MRYIIALLLLTACATPVTVLQDKHGNAVMCGGGTAGSWLGGLVGYTIQENNDYKCVHGYAQQGYKIVTPE